LEQSAVPIVYRPARFDNLADNLVAEHGGSMARSSAGDRVEVAATQGASRYGDKYFAAGCRFQLEIVGGESIPRALE
tara:strand:- start:1003 stop:1233 length:231 start_codon:yes stop_codon:yes gene_type:complete